MTASSVVPLDLSPNNSVLSVGLWACAMAVRVHGYQHSVVCEVNRHRVGYAMLLPVAVQAGGLWVCNGMDRTGCSHMALQAGLFPVVIVC